MSFTPQSNQSELQQSYPPKWDPSNGSRYEDNISIICVGFYPWILLHKHERPLGLLTHSANSGVCLSNYTASSQRRIYETKTTVHWKSKQTQLISWWNHFCGWERDAENERSWLWSSGVSLQAEGFPPRELQTGLVEHSEHSWIHLACNHTIA